MKIEIAQKLQADIKKSMNLNLERFRQSIVNKITRFSSIEAKDLISKSKVSIQIQDVLRRSLMQSYIEWYQRRYKKLPMGSQSGVLGAGMNIGITVKKDGGSGGRGGRGPQTTEEIVNEVSKKLQKVVVKASVDIEPIYLGLCDRTNELVSLCSFDFGVLELLLDEVYTKRHMVGVLGMRVESKKQIKVLATLLEVKLVNHSNLQLFFLPLVFCLELGYITTFFFFLAILSSFLFTFIHF